jgi:hypothetical protein
MKKTLSIFILAGSLSAHSCLLHAAASVTSYEAVEASLREGSPTTTLEKYFNCEIYDGSAYENIASGEPRWISLAERMLQHSDACYTEGIQASLGKAMQKSPQNVLPLVDKTATLAAGYICLPFISSELSIKLQLAEVIKSKKAIRRVHDKRLRTQKAACLRFIKSLEAKLIDQQSSAP